MSLTHEDFEMKGQIENLLVCSECLSWICNGDATGLDYFYDEVEAEERLNLIVEGERRLSQRYLSVSFSADDSHRDQEFSKSPCECCGTDLYGARFAMQGLTREEADHAA